MIRRTEFNPFVLNDYPTSDGRPMAETDWHRDLMAQLIATLQHFFRDQPNTYVSGNLLVFYRPNDKRRHVSPDVFVTNGVPKGSRPNYLIWEEGKPPEVVIELTSKTTKREDLTTKMALYRDEMKVKEYFLFDPLEDYLKPSMQGFRLVSGEYRPIRLKDGRFPSRVLGLHLERNDVDLRLWNPTTGQWLPTDSERAESAIEQAAHERERAEQARGQALQEQERAVSAEAEVDRLRKLLALRHPHGNGTNGA